MTERDRIAARALEREGFIVMHHSEREKPWFVGAGSHGGSGKTINRAMKACMACCKIRTFWKTRSGRDIRKVFDEIAEKWKSSDAQQT